jgi:predicted acetyltransferase
MPPDIGADFVIENVAKLPESRRRGLIVALIHEILRDAGRRGCRLAQASKLTEGFSIRHIAVTRR